LGAAAMAPLVIDVAYLRDAFDLDDARRTSQVVAMLSPLFVLSMMQAVVIGAHNARRSGWTLFAAGILTAGANLALDLALAPILGVAGIALSSSLALAVSIGSLLVLLDRREPHFDLRAVASVLARSF